MPVYLYWGEEEFNLDSEVKKLREKLVDKSMAALSHKMLSEPEITELLESLQTVPLMFGNLLIEVQSTSLFMRGKKKASSTDDLIKKLINTLENLNEKIHVLFVCPIERDSGKKVDGVAKLTKVVQKIGKVVEFPAFKFYQEDKIISWIENRARGKDIGINRNAAELLLQNTGPELRKLDLELEKIKTCIHPKNIINLEEVKNMSSNHENIFSLAEHWLSASHQDGILELQKLFERNHPLRIIATLQTIVKRWLRIKIESKNKNSFEVSKIVNLPKFVVEQDMRKLSKVSGARLLEMKENVHNAEYKIKSGELPPELALEILLAS